jgi:hypothetical protein
MRLTRFSLASPPLDSDYEVFAAHFVSSFAVAPKLNRDEWRHRQGHKRVARVAHNAVSGLSG